MRRCPYPHHGRGFAGMSIGLPKPVTTPLPRSLQGWIPGAGLSLPGKGSHLLVYWAFPGHNPKPVTARPRMLRRPET
jgi:hypothetical protein